MCLQLLCLTAATTCSAFGMQGMQHQAEADGSWFITWQ
jgi:hypothetical protein